MAHEHHGDGIHLPMASPGTTKTDPVCGMSVKADSPHRLEHAGETYVFCCAGCLAKFRDNPTKYTPTPSRADPFASAAQAGLIRPALPTTLVKRGSEGTYTCPMHPEIVRDGPGACPICGMALEPRTITSTPEDDSELRSMSQRLWVSAALTAPLLVGAMAEMIPNHPFAHAFESAKLAWLQLAM